MQDASPSFILNSETSQQILRTRTGRVKDALGVEQEIARVRGEIEQMEDAQKTLEHRVEFVDRNAFVSLLALALGGVRPASFALARPRGVPGWRL